MFIVSLHYIKPLAEVDALIGEHKAFLEQHYASGNFLLSGRKEPRTGGVIVARAASREELAQILSQDPFQRAGVTQYEVTEFLPSMAASTLIDLISG